MVRQRAADLLDCWHGIRQRPTFETVMMLTRFATLRYPEITAYEFYHVL